MSTETIQIDLDDETVCMLVERYVVKYLSDPSVKMFEELADDIGVDRDRIFHAAGQAVLNEMMNVILEASVNQRLRPLEVKNDSE